MTEDEAKTKWCPHVAAAIATKADVKFAGNRTVNAENGGGIVAAPAHALCIASACMAWRWRVTRPQIGGSYPVGGGQPTIIYGPPETSKTEGYCGLAGAPQ